MPRTDGHAGELTARVQPLEDIGTPDVTLFKAGYEGVLLAGARSASSGIAVFPAKLRCPVTAARDMEPAWFGPRGQLYSFATVLVSSTRKVPYTLGYVDFEGGLRVLAVVEGENLHCDQSVVLEADGVDWWVRPEGDL